MHPNRRFPPRRGRSTRHLRTKKDSKILLTPDQLFPVNQDSDDPRPDSSVPANSTAMLPVFSLSPIFATPLPRAPALETISAPKKPLPAASQRPSTTIPRPSPTLRPQPLVRNVFPTPPCTCFVPVPSRVRTLPVPIPSLFRPCSVPVPSRAGCHWLGQCDRPSPPDPRPLFAGARAVCPAPPGPADLASVDAVTFG